MIRGTALTAILTTTLLAACGGASPAPAPTPAVPSVPALPANPVVQVTGRVVTTVTGEPLGGILVDLSGLQTTTDAGGSFGLTWDTSTRPGFGRATLTGPNILSRGLTIGTSASRDITIDAIALGNGFDPDYYRRFVRGTVEYPDAPRTLRRWTRAPRVYLKTVDEAGTAIEEATLGPTEIALADEAAAWTGGRFGLAEIVRGTESREGVSGWITVKWPNPVEPGICGRAQIAVEGGWIELNYLNPNCACMGSRVARGTVRHEIGHALGFFHTEDPEDLLSTVRSYNRWCDGRPSARERLHAAIAYSRPVGNLDPDIDPGTTIQRRDIEPIVVVD